MTQRNERPIPPNDRARYIGACERLLHSFGVTEENHIAFQYKNDKDRWSAWLAESLAYGLRDRDRRVAVRCLLQVREYLGRLGGYWPNSNVHDAYIAFQNEVEGWLIGGNAPLPRMEWTESE